MTFSGIADTLIVLVALYTALAVASSFINEAIASVLQLRGLTLFRGIVGLLAASPALAEKLYSSPFITAASDGGNAKPSYIEARTFSVALWQMIRQAPNTSVAATAAALAPVPKRLIDDARARVAAIGPAGSDPYGALKPALTTLLESAGDDYEALLKATDTWFNRQMDRVSGWYRRQTQWILLAIAFVIAFGFGVDSIQIVTRLYGDAAVRTIVAKQITSSYAAATTQTPDAFAHNIDMSLSASSIPIDAFVDTNLRHFVWQRFTSIQRFLGALITLVAITLGAPFWFDVLGNIVNVRMAGAKPEASSGAPAPVAPPAPVVLPAPLAAAVAAVPADPSPADPLSPGPMPAPAPLRQPAVV